MIPTGVQIFLALEPVDMRWSFDRLSGAAQEAIGYDARSGALFVFYVTVRGWKPSAGFPRAAG
jgi:transposase